MKAFTKAAITICVAVGFSLPSFAVRTAEEVTVSAAGTGYTDASQVKYVYNGKYIANWGAREETCVFVSTYGEAFYTGSYVYDTLSKQNGGSSSSAPQSTLYKSLQSLMKGKHTTITTYDGTRNLYCYTECVKSNTARISSFYLGNDYSSTWNSGATWNREHVWPKSKCIYTNKTNDSADLMTLRATKTEENTARDDIAYGQSSGYYDPDKNGEKIRGDCARMILYNYVRWGNTSIWGASNVMESMNVLLEWMKEDPVDTWEMGRNDAVQAITGTRNVFIDYPEYAWLLFNQSVPADYVTPSKAKRTGQSGGSQDSSSGSSSSSSEDSSSSSSNSSSNSSSSNSSESSGSSSELWESSEETEEQKSCDHAYDEWFITLDPTETEEGMQVRTCPKCGKTEKESIPALGGASSSEEESKPGLAGCGASIGLSVSGVLLLAGCFLFLKERKN